MKATLAIVGTCVLVLLIIRFEHLRIITTDSAAAPGIYATRHGQLRRGQLVLACLPANTARLALRNGYLGAGDCSTGVEPVAKIIGAVPGDTVDLEAGFVEVNSVRLPNSPTVARDSANRPLIHAGWGVQKVQVSQVWLFGFNNPRSWDGRYFGPVLTADVIGELIPLITW